MSLLLAAFLAGHLYLAPVFRPTLGGSFEHVRIESRMTSGEQLEPINGAELVLRGSF